MKIKRSSVFHFILSILFDISIVIINSTPGTTQRACTYTKSQDVSHEKLFYFYETC